MKEIKELKKGFINIHIPEIEEFENLKKDNHKKSNKKSLVFLASTISALAMFVMTISIISNISNNGEDIEKELVLNTKIYAVAANSDSKIFLSNSGLLMPSGKITTKKNPFLSYKVGSKAEELYKKVDDPRISEKERKKIYDEYSTYVDQEREKYFDNLESDIEPLYNINWTVSNFGCDGQDIKSVKYSAQNGVFADFDDISIEPSFENKNTYNYNYVISEEVYKEMDSVPMPESGPNIPYSGQYYVDHFEIFKKYNKVTETILGEQLEKLIWNQKVGMRFGKKTKDTVFETEQEYFEYVKGLGVEVGPMRQRMIEVVITDELRQNLTSLRDQEDIEKIILDEEYIKSLQEQGIEVIKKENGIIEESTNDNILEVYEKEKLKQILGIPESEKLYNTKDGRNPESDIYETILSFYEYKTPPYELGNTIVVDGNNTVNYCPSFEILQKCIKNNMSEDYSGLLNDIITIEMTYNNGNKEIQKVKVSLDKYGNMIAQLI